MMFNTDLLHTASIDLLYASIVVLTFVIIERLAYYAYLNMVSRSIGNAIHKVVMSADRSHPMPKIKRRSDVLSQAMVEYVEMQRQSDMSYERLEDLSAALYLRVDSRVNVRLWILDTIVTAAPLLGLLGTILGIMDTFTALSAGGISDPGAVSRGIGTALFATAMGIGTALFGLIGHNVLHRLSEIITDAFKSFLLETTAYAGEGTSGNGKRKEAASRAA